MAKECEAKIRVESLIPLRQRLHSLGASNEGDSRERNWVYDDMAGSLVKSGVLLRVRTLGTPEAILTVKRRVEGGRFKTREEVETMIDSVEELMRQLEILGYVAVWRYEKFRQIWLWKDCVVALDECPELGFFVEIEGEPDRITELCRDLGLDPAAHIDDNYLGLWIKHLEERGERRRDMLFSTDPKEWGRDSLTEDTES